ncbi:MAG TPA: carboxypeptidase-like regulatory domain-containing protein [Chitinophagaceae bacterium]|nr:carboxypeptidase-like regulatory domain-containing protein [Chitinophagaceae bacterium]
MKPKTLLLVFTFIFGSLLAKANNDPGKKEDIMGTIVNADGKKPIKDVSVTAYLSSKKEKVVITDGSGAYSFDDLKPGVYKFVFEKDGYKKVIKEKVCVKVDEGFQMDIEMLQDNAADVMPSLSHFLYN